MPVSSEDPEMEARERARRLTLRLFGVALPGEELSWEHEPAAKDVEAPRADPSRPGHHAGLRGDSTKIPGASRPNERGRGSPEGGERIDETHCRELLAEIATARILEYVVPVADGARAPMIQVRAIVAVREALAYASGLLDLLFTMQGLGSFPITLAGTKEQKTRFLPGIASGRSVAAFAVTEPDAGSDVSAIRACARAEGNGYVLDGTKTFISNAPFADVITAIVRTGPAEGKKGLTAFIVEGSARGLERRADIDLMAPHPIGTLVFQGCRIPAENRLGAEGDGFGIAMATLDTFRTTVGAAATGFARRALDEAMRFAASRIQFGRPVADFEGIRFKIADMATKLEAARLLVERAAWSADRRPHASGSNPTHPLSPLGEDPARDASMAKLFATEAAQEIADEAVQIHGGRGLVRGNIVESLYREVRALRIYEGTSEIQRTLIGRSLIGR